MVLPDPAPPFDQRRVSAWQTTLGHFIKARNAGAGFQRICAWFFFWSSWEIFFAFSYLF